MAGKRRRSQVELNFDGLTDSVTNLVGALVLIVVLLIGVTREAIYSAPTAAEVPAEEAAEGPKSVEELFTQVEILREQIRRTDLGIRKNEAQIPKYQAQVQQLVNRSE